MSFAILVITIGVIAASLDRRLARIEKVIQIQDDSTVQYSMVVTGSTLEFRRNGSTKIRITASGVYIRDQFGELKSYGKAPLPDFMK